MGPPLVTLWGAPLEVSPDTLAVRGVGAHVDADGSNGLTTVSPEEAKRRGLYAPPGAERVPLCCYSPTDWGARSSWIPAGRLPLGMDAPENGGRILRNVAGEITGIKAWGFLMGADGKPHRQSDGDPAPGYYLSTTSLVDPAYPPTDARRYFDSASLCGWVTPGNSLADHGVGLGDFALVSYQGRSVWCQAFDSGNPGADAAELSVGACIALGINPDARRGGVTAGVDIVILPGSHSVYAPSERPYCLDALEIDFYGRQAGQAAGIGNT